MEKQIIRWLIEIFLFAKCKHCFVRYTASTASITCFLAGFRRKVPREGGVFTMLFLRGLYFASFFPNKTYILSTDKWASRIIQSSFFFLPVKIRISIIHNSAVVSIPHGYTFPWFCQCESQYCTCSSQRQHFVFHRVGRNHSYRMFAIRNSESDSYSSALPPHELVSSLALHSSVSSCGVVGGVRSRSFYSTG